MIHSPTELSNFGTRKDNVVLIGSIFLLVLNVLLMLSSLDFLYHLNFKFGNVNSLATQIGSILYIRGSLSIFEYMAAGLIWPTVDGLLGHSLLFRNLHWPQGN